jgi:cob(I)alamin adenosyltransferase
MLSGKYDLIILDEICVSIHFGLFNDEEILTFMKMKPDSVELILTGRYCPDKIMEAADLVTEMKVLKHYYLDGVLARKGIES